MKTLELFNAVVAKPSIEHVWISDSGYIIEPNALWAKDKIVSHYRKAELNGNDLNKTFHKSWDKVKNSSRFELFVDQIFHYLSTYGTMFEGEVYIPNEVLDIPDVELTYKVIKAYTVEEMTNKCLGLLRSGIALKEETIDDVLAVLTDELGYVFTGDEGVRNKEAIVKIADLYGVLPKETMAFFRYVIYRATGESLLIKNGKSIAAIKASNYNPSAAFNQFGVEKLAEIFNRFKPLFLAFKSKCPKTINKISKMSKFYHKPLVQNPLGVVTSQQLTMNDEHWLDNATPFALFKAMTACFDNLKNRDSFVYRIRNGKSWVTEREGKTNDKATLISSHNLNYLSSYIHGRFGLEGKKIFLPKDIDYALPTSEKMFVGNIPTGTKFHGDKLAVGVYWKNSWGARDLDLSSIDISGAKVGWNSSYDHRGLTYSGDITNAPNGAVEYLYASSGQLGGAALVQNNVYMGDDECSYKIIIGRGDEMSRDYMMNPNNLFAEIKCQSVQKQTILGLFLPGSFVVLNFGAGHARVSGSGKTTSVARNALYQQWNNSLTFNDLVTVLGAEIVDSREEADYDYSLDSLEKDSFTKLFSEEGVLV